MKDFLKKPKGILFLIFFAFMVFSILFSFFQKDGALEPKTGLKSSVYEAFIPGKTTEKEVIKAIGDPSSIGEREGKKYYIYQTESVNFNNSVVFKDGKVYYSVENFFGDFERSPEYYLKKYGTPEASLYDLSNDTIVWSVFPKHGVATAVFPFEGLIGKVLYFSPQTMSGFEQSFNQELGLTREIKEEEEELVAPGY